MDMTKTEVNYKVYSERYEDVKTIMFYYPGYISWRLIVFGHLFLRLSDKMKAVKAIVIRQMAAHVDTATEARVSYSALLVSVVAEAWCRQTVKMRLQTSTTTLLYLD